MINIIISKIFGYNDINYKIYVRLLNKLHYVSNKHSKNTQKHSKTLKNTQKHSKTLKNTQKHSKTLKNTQKHSKTLKNTQKHKQKTHNTHYHHNEIFFVLIFNEMTKDTIIFSINE
jgi:predicted GTPase